MMELNGTTYHEHTPVEVARIIEGARASGKRIRIFYGDPETGEDWMDEHDTMGTIGRSMGPVRIPIMLPNSRSRGGPGILDHCIVKIVDLRSGRKETGGYVVWQHPKYAKPNLSARHIDKDGYKFEVRRDDVVVARFKSYVGAIKWMSFIRGERNAK